MLNGFFKYLELEKFSRSNALIYSWRVLQDYSAGAQTSMPHFGISRLSPCKTNIWTGRLQTKSRIIVNKHVQGLHSRGGNHISRRPRCNSKSIQNHQQNFFEMIFHNFLSIIINGTGFLECSWLSCFEIRSSISSAFP